MRDKRNSSPAQSRKNNARQTQFFQAVQAEAARYQNTEDPMDTKDLENDREALQTELVKAEVAVEALAKIPLDDDLKQVLERRKEKRDEIRKRLHAARLRGR